MARERRRGRCCNYASRRPRICRRNDGGGDVEHAHCLTGRGMRGATVEHATVLASIRDLTLMFHHPRASQRGAAARGSG
jgi:hypothetical protein